MTTGSPTGNVCSMRVGKVSQGGWSATHRVRRRTVDVVELADLIEGRTAGCCPFFAFASRSTDTESASKSAHPPDARDIVDTVFGVAS